MVTEPRMFNSFTAYHRDEGAQEREKQEGVLSFAVPVGKTYAVGRNSGGFTRCNPVFSYFPRIH